MKKIEFLEGGIFTDARGQIRYVNDFDFKGVKRFYVIEHPDTSVVRAWQGHQFERKWFYVTKGSFCVAWVKIDNWENPSKDLKPEYVVLKDTESQILCVPTGYANGLKALEPGSKIIVYSDMDVEESIKEKIRYDKDLWMEWDNISK